MLTVILKILSILGIILLVILGVLLLVLLLVLFFPIIYRIKADRHRINQNAQQNDVETMESEFALHANVKAWWLFGLLRARLIYPKPGKLKVKLLFFTIYESEEVGATKLPESEETDDEAEVGQQSSTPKQQTSEEVITSKSSQSRPESDEAKMTDSVEQTSKMEPARKIHYTMRNICDKIKEIFENISYYKEVLLCDESKEVYKRVFMRLGKILKNIRPRKLHADIRYGTGAPDTTGYTYAVYGMLCSYLGKHVTVSPDFEQSILEGDLYAKGYITLFPVLWNILMLIKDQELLELKDKLKR